MGDYYIIKQLRIEHSDGTDTIELCARVITINVK